MAFFFIFLNCKHMRKNWSFFFQHLKLLFAYNNLYCKITVTLVLLWLSGWVRKHCTMAGKARRTRKRSWIFFSRSHLPNSCEIWFGDLFIVFNSNDIIQRSIRLTQARLAIWWPKSEHEFDQGLLGNLQGRIQLAISRQVYIKETFICY